MSKIFVRERRKVEKGEKKPRFRVVGVSGGDIKVYAKHLRRIELEAIAESVGADIVYLPKGGEGEYSGSEKDGSGRMGPEALDL
jgi:hypothetical protein